MTTTPFRIGFVLFDHITQLDFTGPLQVLSRLPGAEIHLVAKSMEPVRTDGVLNVPPTTRFDDCPPLDLICVPGGFGVNAAMGDAALIDFVARQGREARYVTSVCTGTFILGAAGLLEGRRATTHWAYHEALALTGAIPVKARVVRDGNLFTGGGVTAGIDFALTVLAELAGEDAAKSVQLLIEYNPAPPFSAGSPDTAPADILARAKARYGERLPAFNAALQAAIDARS